MKDDVKKDMGTVVGLVGFGLLCHAAWAYDPLLGEAAIGLTMLLFYSHTQKELRQRKKRE